MQQDSKNRLKYQKSAYLLQHAKNPIHWYAWSQKAVDVACKEDKPIFLSIGYSTCHWCHVMAHESFEGRGRDGGVAGEDVIDLLNQNFISIKLDREERPDVDKLYMSYIVAVNGHGGWPISVWLTPALKPFFGRTYIPPDDNVYGIPGFKSILSSIAHKWKVNKEEVCDISDKSFASLLTFNQALSFSQGSSSGSALSSKEDRNRVVVSCIKNLLSSFDSVNGGFGSAPKFPQVSNLKLLLSACSASDKDGLLSIEESLRSSCTNMLVHTLTCMGNGGIYDHIGGGFHRYSTDNAWHVPHFEKMLYDQAQMLSIYSQAFDLISKDPLSSQAGDNSTLKQFRRVCDGIVGFVFEHFLSDDFGFVAAQDADSVDLGRDSSGRKIEGAFYVWTRDEVEVALKMHYTQSSSETGEDLSSILDIVCDCFGISKLKGEGNVPKKKDPHNEFSGKNILYLFEDSLANLSSIHRIESQENLDKILDEAKRALKRYRSDSKCAPDIDSKVITSWNGHMFSALAKYSCIFGRVDILKKCVDSIKSIKSKCFTFAPEGYTLLRVPYGVSFDGEETDYDNLTHIHGCLDDYACLIQAIIEIVKAISELEIQSAICDEELLKVRVEILQWAYQLQDLQDEKFWDFKNGAYFLSEEQNSTNNNPLILRMKEQEDGAEPCSNSVSALNLIHLYHLSHEDKYLERYDKLILSFSHKVTKIPHSLPLMLSSFFLLPKSCE